MLLKKANTITTPTAYSNGFLHSVKPEVVLGEELVTNGDFSQSGTATTSSYSLGWYSADVNDVVISSGVMTIYNVSGSGGRAYATDGSSSINIITSGKKYRLTYTVIENNGVSSFLYHNGSAYVSAPLTLGTHTIDYTASGSIFLFKNNSTGTNIVLDNVSLKERLDADFTFTRNSSATRVNELGYIEDVQIIGGELVSNGDFEEIGSELVVNGSFDTDTAWVKQAGWTISGGTANFVEAGGNRNIYQSILTLGKFYQLTFTVSNYVSGSIRNISNPSYTDYNADGTYTEIFSPTTYTNLFLNCGFGSELSIDNVSVKEVGQDWTFGTGWSMGDGVASINNDTGNLDQSFAASAGNKYRVTFTISNYVSGSMRWRFTGTSNENGTYRSANGTYTEDITLTNNQSIFRFAATATEQMDIDNVSIKLVTDDTNLPRINYEGFTYAESLGDNVVVNGTFDTDSNWSKTNAVISGGVATITSTGYAYAAIVQNNVLTIGKRYKATIDIKSITGGIIIGASDTITSGGIISEYFTATQTYLEVRRDSAYATTIATIDNVSVQEVIGDLPVPYSGKGHLLLEPQRTNLFTYSEDIDEWSTSNTGITLEENAVTSPEGVANATKIKEDGTNAAHATRQLTGPVLSSGTDYAFSFFAKKAERSIVGLSNTIGASNDKICFFDLDNGQILTNTFNSASIEDFGNGWYRCIAIDTADANDDYDTRIYTATADNQFSHQGVSGSGLYIFGLQLEAGSYETSYIPTLNGTTVTRLGETCEEAGNSDLFDDCEVFYVDFKYLDGLGSDNQNWFALESDSGLTRVLFYKGGTTNQRILVENNSTVIYANTSLFSLERDIQYKLAVRFTSGNISVFLNGVQIDTDSTTYTFAENLTTMTLNESAQKLASKIKMVATFPYLSNDEMECLTGEGYGTFEALAAAYSYTIK